MSGPDVIEKRVAPRRRSVTGFVAESTMSMEEFLDRLLLAAAARKDV
jgi:hypothetical protein